MDREDMNNIILRENEKKLFMSSVPRNCRDEFVKFAEEEFGDNYGSCFKYVWENFKLWQQVMYNIDLKLNYIIDQLSKSEDTKPEPEGKFIKTLSGRKIKLKEVNNE